MEEIWVKSRTLLLLVAFVLLASGCIGQPPASGQPGTNASQPGSQPSQSGTLSIDIRGFEFNPPGPTIAAGTTVTWTNVDPMAHTITSDTGAFESGQIAQGGTFSHTFNTPGTYHYHCSNHPSMLGTINVS